MQMCRPWHTRAELEGNTQSCCPSGRVMLSSDIHSQIAFHADDTTTDSLQQILAQFSKFFCFCVFFFQQKKMGNWKQLGLPKLLRDGEKPPACQCQL